MLNRFQQLDKYFMQKGCAGLPEIPKNMETQPCLIDLREVIEVATALDDNHEISGCVVKFKNGNSIWVSNDFEEVKKLVKEFFEQKNLFKLN